MISEDLRGSLATGECELVLATRAAWGDDRSEL